VGSNMKVGDLTPPNHTTWGVPASADGDDPFNNGVDLEGRPPGRRTSVSARAPQYHSTVGGATPLGERGVGNGG